MTKATSNITSSKHYLDKVLVLLTYLLKTLGSYSPLEQTTAACLQSSQATSQLLQPVDTMTTFSAHQSADCQSDGFHSSQTAHTRCRSPSISDTHHSQFITSMFVHRRQKRQTRHVQIETQTPIPQLLEYTHNFESENHCSALPTSVSVSLYKSNCTQNECHSVLSTLSDADSILYIDHRSVGGSRTLLYQILTLSSLC